MTTTLTFDFNVKDETNHGKFVIDNMRIDTEEDINGALNILVKSSVVSMNTLYSSGEVDTPVRIRLS